MATPWRGREAKTVGNIWQFYCQIALSDVDCAFAGLPGQSLPEMGYGSGGRDFGKLKEMGGFLALPPFRRVRQSRCGDDPVVLQKLWYDRPVRTQLLIAIGAINLIAALLAEIISVLNTRTATRVEIEASLEIAQRFVSATMKDLATQNRLGELQQELPLELKHLRHVRIMFMDTMGQLTIVSPQLRAWSVPLGRPAGSQPWYGPKSSAARSEWLPSITPIP